MPWNLTAFFVPGLTSRLLDQHTKFLGFVRELALPGTSASYVPVPGGPWANLGSVMTGLLPEHHGLSASFEPDAPLRNPTFLTRAQAAREGFSSVWIRFDLPAEQLLARDQLVRQRIRANPSFVGYIFRSVARDKDRVKAINDLTTKTVAGSLETPNEHFATALIGLPEGDTGNDPLDRPVVIVHKPRLKKPNYGACELSNVLLEILTGQEIPDALDETP